MITNFLRSHLKSSHKDLFKKLEDVDKKNKNFAPVFSKSIAKIRKVRACGAIFLARWPLKR
jgi:hypothetical protein